MKDIPSVIFVMLCVICLKIRDFGVQTESASRSLLFSYAYRSFSEVSFISTHF